MSLGTHAQRLERWLEPGIVEGISHSMRHWPGPPIALAVPGLVWAHGGGDFRGPLDSGGFASALDYAMGRLGRLMRDTARRQQAVCNLGFSGLADFQSKASRRQTLPYKVDGAFVDAIPAGTTVSTWAAGILPPAGANASAAPGGRVPTSATTGALKFANATSGLSLHVAEARMACDNALHNLMLFDRLFDVAKTASSTATEAVTGVPTRYQSTTPSDPDYAGGNFVFPEVGASADLGATAHNWTVCQYTNQAGTTGISFPSVAGVSGAFGWQVDLGPGTWFMPFASGDTGVQALTQMQNSASVTGAVNFVIGHALAFMPSLIANRMARLDGLRSCFNLCRVFDDACLTFLELTRTATAAALWQGNLTLAEG